MGKSYLKASHPRAPTTTSDGPSILTDQVGRDVCFGLNVAADSTLGVRDVMESWAPTGCRVEEFGYRPGGFKT
jgi:hypothetical protein